MKKALSKIPMDDRSRENFLRLYEKFISGPSMIGDWDHVRSPDEKYLLPYASLKIPGRTAVQKNLSKIVVCKLNGGLGTSMGCRTSKSSIVVRESKSFLDLIVDQLRGIERDFGINVPLILMNSFYTHNETKKIIEKYQDWLEVKSFQQSQFPRLLEDSHQPLTEEEFGLAAWYPPGHGDFYSCIFDLGFLDRLLEEGREVAFVSNADNLGAVMDPSILTHILDNDIPFLIETTPKTPADVKGGTIYQDGEQLKLLEIASVPEERKEEFCSSQRKFKVFNTNNLWIHLRHLRKQLEKGPLDLNVIVNRKTVSGKKVIQLETAIGSALECFQGAVGLVASRDRFLPVKTTGDLLLIQSNLFVLRNGKLVRNPERKQSTLPRVQLGGEFTSLHDFQDRIPSAPNMLEMDSLEVNGDVRFGKGVQLKGKVQLTAVDKPLMIEDGTILQDRVVDV